MTHTAKRTALLCILPLLLLATLLCLPKAALAATIDVANPGSDAGWDYDGSTKTLTISSNGHTLTGSNSELRIVVGDTVTALTLHNLTVTAPSGTAGGLDSPGSAGWPALEASGNLTVTVSGTVTLTGGAGGRGGNGGVDTSGYIYTGKKGGAGGAGSAGMDVTGSLTITGGTLASTGGAGGKGGDGGLGTGVGGAGGTGGAGIRAAGGLAVTSCTLTTGGGAGGVDGTGNAIGGVRGASGDGILGDVTANSGSITASGYAGIRGSVKSNHGSMKATGGSGRIGAFGAGSGGVGIKGAVTGNSGSIKAVGGSGSGLSSGGAGIAGAVTGNSGTITATGGSGGFSGGAGITGAVAGNSGTITAAGGSGGFSGGAGITGAVAGNSGTITATGGSGGFGRGAGISGTASNSGTITATGSSAITGTATLAAVNDADTPTYLLTNKATGNVTVARDDTRPHILYGEGSNQSDATERTDEMSFTYRLTTNTQTIFMLPPRLQPPTVSPARSVINEPQSVTLSAADGATIYYTLDGSDPVTDPNGTRQPYIGAITVEPGDTLKAYATKTDWADSGVLTVSYTQLSSPGYGGYSSPIYAQRTLTHASGITVSGVMASGAGLEVTAQALHAEGRCAACDDIRARQAAGEVIVLYDISVSGSYTGALEVSIPVSGQYEGQTVTILHCKNGVLESVPATVHNGRATGTFARLSPFAVVLGAQVTVPDEVELDPPKTGDAPTGGMGLVLLALGLAAVVRRRKLGMEK